MRDLTTITTAYVLLFAHQVSATVGVLNIADLLEPNLEDPLSASQEIAQPYAPWTHKPHCAVSTSLASLGQKYCVYTSNITGPYGLSLISTPAHARLATEHLNDIPLSSFFTPAEASTLYSNPSPWKIVNIRGKDKGVIATRKIAKYETFMIDQAAVVVDLSFSDAMTQTEESAMLKVAVDRLLVPGLIRDMSSSHAESGEGSLESDIMMTNSFGSTVAGVSTKTLFPIISRINHACNPNSFVMFSRAGVSMAIKAYRDIEEGEEIIRNRSPPWSSVKKTRPSLETLGLHMLVFVVLAASARTGGE